MKIGIHDAEMEHFKRAKFPNYAIMKISAYHKRMGDTVSWWSPFFEYDKVYSSKVFDFTPDNPYLPVEAIRGGTGYVDLPINNALPKEIDDSYPDYSIYPECDYAIGYLTRGCPNHCRWCVVPKKEGDIYPYRAYQELVRPDTNKLVLMDNNILASSYGIEQLQELSETEYKIDLNQGMDARLVTPEIAKILSKIKWIRYIRFSCDQKSQIEHIHKAITYLNNNGVKPYRVFVYMLVTSDIQDAVDRVNALKVHHNINLYAQAERNPRLGIVPNKLQLEFCQRYVYSGRFRLESWEEYCSRHNIKFYY